MRLRGMSRAEEFKDFTDLFVVHSRYKLLTRDNTALKWPWKQQGHWFYSLDSISVIILVNWCEKEPLSVQTFNIDLKRTMVRMFLRALQPGWVPVKSFKEKNLCRTILVRKRMKIHQQPGRLIWLGVEKVMIMFCSFSHGQPNLSDK